MTFYKNDKLGLFIDGASFYSVQRACGFDCDYKMLLKEMSTRGRLQTVNFYSLVTTDTVDPMMPLIDWLSYNGYNVKLKETRLDVNNRKIGSCDVNMAVDMVHASTHLDHIVYFGAKRDVSYALDAMRINGARSTVISTLDGADGPVVADGLRRAADNFVDFKALKNIHKPPRDEDYLAA